MHNNNKKSDDNPNSLRISVDTKAKVNISESSRNGKSRDLETPEGGDHDMESIAKLVPCGILEVVEGKLSIIVGNSKETSDFIVDSIEQWWDKRKSIYTNIDELVINIDNGPSVESYRTQFIKRMIEFSDANNLRIHLVYYPPYHSKYNPIEHCWGSLERNWNGAILNTIDKAVEWMKSMTWKGIKPTVQLLDKVYEKGVSVTKKEMKKYSLKLTRSKTLPKWDVVIEGAFG